MEYRPYGPRGAESEREDFWTDIPEGSDMVPDRLWATNWRAAAKPTRTPN